MILLLVLRILLIIINSIPNIETIGFENRNAVIAKQIYNTPLPILPI